MNFGVFSILTLFPYVFRDAWKECVQFDIRLREGREGVDQGREGVEHRPLGVV